MDDSKSGNAVLAERAIALLGQREFDALRAMMAEDFRAEGPFHPNGAAVFQGADAAMRDFRQIKAFDSFALTIIDLWDIGDTVIIEARSNGKHRESDRLPYANHYLFVLSFSRGKLTLWREFYNPLEAMKQGYGKRPA